MATAPNYPTFGIHPELAPLITNESVQPSQWADMHRGASQHDPIKRLAVAIIEQAICDLQMSPQPESGHYKTNHTKLNRQADARDWFATSDPMGEYAPSMEEVLLGGVTFDQCCGILDINPDAARVRILTGQVTIIRRHLTVVGRLNQITAERYR